MNDLATRFDGLPALQTRDPLTIPLSLQSIMLYGPPGSGKSSLAAGFPDHAYWDLENSATGLAIRPLPVEKSWAAFKQFLEWAVTQEEIVDADGEPVKTLIIDTVSELWRMCLSHWLNVLGVERQSEAGKGEGWTLPRADFKDTMDLLWEAQAKGIMGCVLIAHEVPDELTDDNGTSRRIEWPEVDDKKMRAYLAAKPQMVLRTIIAQSHPRTGVAWPEPRWVVQTTPSVAGAITKDRTGRLPELFGTRFEAFTQAYNSTETEEEND